MGLILIIQTFSLLLYNTGLSAHVPLVLKGGNLLVVLVETNGLLVVLRIGKLQTLVYYGCCPPALDSCQPEKVLQIRSIPILLF